MSCYCKCPVAFPHGAVGGLQFVIVVFPDHTHLRFHHSFKRIIFIKKGNIAWILCDSLACRVINPITVYSSRFLFKSMAVG